MTTGHSSSLSTALLFLAAVVAIVALVSGEIALRIFVPRLGSDVGRPSRQKRIANLFEIDCVLSTREIGEWYQRYTAAQKKFASQLDDVILIDVAAASVKMGKKERLRNFIDYVHLMVKGNRVMAKNVFDGISNTTVSSKEKRGDLNGHPAH